MTKAAPVAGDPSSGPKTGDNADPRPEAWGVGRGMYGAGEVHPSGGRRQAPLFLTS